MGCSIYMWDVRQGRSMLMSLDQFNAQSPQPGRRTSAHDGPVNSVCFTSDGLELLSLGSDSRMRKWDATSGRNTLVNYPDIRCRSRLAVRMGVSTHSRIPMVR